MAPGGAATPRSRKRETRERSRQRIVEAANELVRERSAADLNIGEVMDRAGIGRTLFYRHFDDLGDLLMRVGREAMDELYDAQVALASARVEPTPEAVHEAIEPAVDVYVRHGPLLRALAEAAPADPLVEERTSELRERFVRLLRDTIQRATDAGAVPVADPTETARALVRLNEGYLLDAFGHGERIDRELAVSTLTDIWLGFVLRRWGT
jgi:AcrR family transcriptional regulator